MDLSRLETKLSLQFSNPAIYEQAFTHRSYLNEHTESTLHNERLEFLGDAVVELIVTRYLYDKFPEKPEGELTNLRAALVRRNSLSVIGEEIGLEEYIRLSKGEARNSGKAKSVILSNATEAFIGALYLDLGIPAVEQFLNQCLLPKLDQIVEEESHIDAKSSFQEKIQEKEGVTPHYKTEKVTGPDHDRHFVVGIYIGDKLVAYGEGSSKREAEMAAATKALAEL